jgi:hypothetical protein
MARWDAKYGRIPEQRRMTQRRMTPADWAALEAEAAETVEDAHQDAQEGQQAALPQADTVSTPASDAARQRPYSERQRTMRPVTVDWDALEELEARRSSSPISRPVVAAGLFK